MEIKKMGKEDTLKLIVTVSEGETIDALSRRMMNQSDADFFLCPEFCVEAGTQQFCYDLSGLQSLQDLLLSNKYCITSEEYQQLMMKLCRAGMDAEAHLIPLNSCLWNMEQIFFDAAGNLKLIIVPIQRETMSSNLGCLFRQLPLKVRVKDAASHGEVLKIQQYLSKPERLNLRDLRDFLLKVHSDFENNCTRVAVVRRRPEIIEASMFEEEQTSILRTSDGAEHSGTESCKKEGTSAKNLRETTVLTSDKNWHKNAGNGWENLDQLDLEEDKEEKKHGKGRRKDNRNKEKKNHDGRSSLFRIFHRDANYPAGA